MITGTSIEKVSVSQIKEIPVQSRHTSHKMIHLISQVAKEDSGVIDTVRLGRVNKQLYPVDDIEIVQGLKKASIPKVGATITEYASLGELVIDHVRANFEPHAIDPLLIQDVLEYLEKKGFERQDACRVLWLERRPEILKALRAKLSSGARKILLEMLDEVSKKTYFAVTPAYYITRLAKISAEEQVAAAREIKSITIPNMISDEKCSWPSIDAISSVLSKYHRDAREIPVEERIGTYEDVQDIAKKPNGDTKKADTRLLKKAEKFIGSDPNMIYIPMKGKQPDLMVHKKTGRVAVAKETDGTYCVTDDLGKPTHVLPEHVVKYLELDNGDSVHIYKYPTLAKAKSALEKAKLQDTRCIILCTSSLPKR